MFGNRRKNSSPVYTPAQPNPEHHGFFAREADPRTILLGDELKLVADSLKRASTLSHLTSNPGIQEYQVIAVDESMGVPVNIVRLVSAHKIFADYLTSLGVTA